VAGTVCSCCAGFTEDRVKHLTKDSKGKPNGYVLEIWSALVNPELLPGQVYQIVIADLWRSRVVTNDAMTAQIWSVLMNPELRPAQVYLTAAIPHSRKGPHLHHKRRGVFICVKGNVRIVQKLDYVHVEMTGVDHDYAQVVVSPGIETAIYNDGDTEALVLNMPSPAWSKEDPDEWPVEGWID
jgi:hypothetical protein